MAFFDGRGVANSYESTVPSPLLPSNGRSYNPPRSYKAPPMVDARSVRVSTHWSGGWLVGVQLAFWAVFREQYWTHLNEY